MMPASNDSVKRKAPRLSIVNHGVVTIESIWILFIYTGDLRMDIWFDIFENHAVNVLFGMSPIDRCIRDISPANENYSFGIRGQWQSAKDEDGKGADIILYYSIQRENEFPLRCSK